MKRNDTQAFRYLTALFVLFILSGITLVGQAPATFNYQAVLRDTDGDPRMNETVSIQLVVHQTTSTGTSVYTETHNTSTNEFGIVNLKVGSVNTASFEAIDWSAGPYFIEVIVNGSSMGASELLTVPYAMHAQTVENVDITGSEAAFAGWDKNASDDFDGAFNSLSGIPAGLSDGDDNTQLNEAQVEAYINGDEASFNGWDKDASDDFDGAFNSLSGIPAGLSDGDDNTQLSEAQVEAYINGDETSFNGWDKNAADDFNGAFSSLTGIPAGLSDGDDNTQLSEAQVEAYINGNEASFNGWDKNAADDITGQTGIQHMFQFITYQPGSVFPAAFGFINADATIESGSGNIACTWNGTYDRYEITITGISYYYSSYTTVVTLCGGGVGLIYTSSVGGNLLIYIVR